MTFEIDAARGAKIISLRDPAGREWLTRSRRTGAVPGMPFGLAEMAGWDECAPTINQCVVDGRRLPDHGDAWDVPWTATGTGLRHAGASWPYVLRRRIVSTGDGGLRLEYSAETTGGAVPFLWTAHPQFAAPPGSRVELSPTPERAVEVSAKGWPVIGWSEQLTSLDALPDGGSRKVYVHPDEPAVTRVVLIRSDGGRLGLTLSPECRYLAIWLDNRAWADEPVIAVEPSLGYADSLEVAVALGTAPTLRPGEPLEWWLAVAPG
ncbi:aldose epimerase family protein [Virgisporangium aurantiacum]|nr:hypothetical protein [Virgisporangium aurantiacum]